jgi:branched-chain amino acid transport system permease protein
VRWLVRGLAGAGAVLVAYLAWNAAPSTLVLMAFACVWGMVGLSLVLLTGWGGNVSLGQFAIVGIGAVVAGNLMVRWNADAFVALAAAGLAGALISALIGIPALRIPGFGLAVATLSFAVTLDAYILNPVNFPDWVPSRIVRPVLWKRFDLGEQRNALWLAMGGLLLAVAVVRAVRRTRIGRVVLATRDNPRFAGALSVPTTRTRLQAFVLAGAIAGVAGGINVIVLGGAGQNTFPPDMSIEVFSYTAIGGLGAPAGALLGILGFRTIDFWLGANLNSDAAAVIRAGLSGFGLLFVLYVMPGGLWQAVQRVRDAVLRRLVPSAYAIGGEGESVSARHEDAPADEVGAIASALGGRSS